MKILKCIQPNHVWAYKDETGVEIIMSDTIYLGKNDDVSRYYEIDKPDDKADDIVVNNEQ